MSKVSNEGKTVAVHCHAVEMSECIDEVYAHYEHEHNKPVQVGCPTMILPLINVNSCVPVLDLRYGE